MTIDKIFKRAKGRLLIFQVLKIVALFASGGKMLETLFV